MRVGVDFDNTIVRYDAVFHAVALEQGLIPAELPAAKERVRDFLRAAGREADWTAMQGYVYGRRMAEADPFPGALEFFRACREAGVAVFIVSHKTRTPYAGPAYDLHAAALGWMEERGLFDPQGVGLPRDHVFLEDSKAGKFARIKALGCTHFVDDLPEFLSDPQFPAGVDRLLFAPAGARPRGPEVTPCASWAEIAGRLLGAGAPRA